MIRQDRFSNFIVLLRKPRLGEMNNLAQGSTAKKRLSQPSLANSSLEFLLTSLLIAMPARGEEREWRLPHHWWSRQIWVYHSSEMSSLEEFFQRLRSFQEMPIRISVSSLAPHSSMKTSFPRNMQDKVFQRPLPGSRLSPTFLP